MEPKFFQEKYNALNKMQKLAVDSIDGPVFVMAGPGTGKTQILTLRIANILKEAGAGIEPDNILALTFTNSAVFNMRERLRSFIGSSEAFRVNIFTFHSFAEHIIAQYPIFFPYLASARLIEDIQKFEILEKIVEEGDYKHFSIFKKSESFYFDISKAIDTIRGEGLSTKEFKKRIEEDYEVSLASDDIRYKKDAKYGKKGDIKKRDAFAIENKRAKNLELADIYQKYQDFVKENSFYDFSDLIFFFKKALKENQQLREILQETYQYILVDEHQDTNDAQNEILYSLISNPVNEGKPNLFVVGDDKQAIYRFAGASSKSFSFLNEVLKGPLIINLEDNYRSGQHILDSSASLISLSKDIKSPANLKAFSKISGDFQYRLFSDYKSEVIFIAKDIKNKIEKGENPDEIAVLVRYNKDLDDFKRAFESYGIAFKDFSKKNLLEDKDILKLFLLLNSVYNLQDNVSLAKVLYIDFLDFDLFAVSKILEKLKNNRKEERKSIISIINSKEILKSLEIATDEIKKFTNFADKIKKWQSDSRNEDLQDFFNIFVRESGFLEYMLSLENSASALSKLEKLFNEIKRLKETRKNFSFEDFYFYLQNLEKHNIKIEFKNTLSSGVSLMTLHSSKGLEFESVYIAKAVSSRGAFDKISLPLNTVKGNIEDERRLFYVGLTRAKKNLYLSSFTEDLEGREKSPVEFIDQIKNLEIVDTKEFTKENTLEFVKLFDRSSVNAKSILSDEYIKEKFLKNKLSVSALNNYLSSPLLYFFRSLIRLPEPKSHHLDFGSLVHKALEIFFIKCKEEGKILPQKDLEISLQEAISLKPHMEDYASKAKELLLNYYGYYKDSFSVPLEIEFNIHAIDFNIPKYNTSIILNGVMDKIVRNEDGEVVVWDYKTGKTYKEKTKEDREKIKNQAVFYKLLLQDYAGGKYDFQKATFDFLEPNKEGLYKRQDFIITDADVQELKDKINLLVEDIFEGKLLDKDFKPDRNNKDYLRFLSILK